MHRMLGMAMEEMANVAHMIKVTGDWSSYSPPSKQKKEKAREKRRWAKIRRKQGH